MLQKLREKLLGVKREPSAGALPDTGKRPKPPSPRTPERSNSGSSAGGGDGDVKLLVLDFDGTLTRAVKVRIGPWAGTASSQHTNGIFKAMSASDHVRNFGGTAEIEAMRGLFIRLRAIGVQLRILSYGHKDNIVTALTTVGLIEYFTEPGMQPGSLVFGSDVPPLSSSDEVYKALVMQEWMEELGLATDEVAFLDDDVNNVSTPAKGEDDVGVQQVLDPGHAHLHVGPFSTSIPWIEDICGLTEPEDDVAVAEELAGTSGGSPSSPSRRS